MDWFISIAILKFSDSKFELDIRFLSQLNKCIDQSLTILKFFGRYFKLDTESFFSINILINQWIDIMLISRLFGAQSKIRCKVPFKVMIFDYLNDWAFLLDVICTRTSPLIFIYFCLAWWPQIQDHDSNLSNLYNPFKQTYIVFYLKRTRFSLLSIFINKENNHGTSSFFGLQSNGMSSRVIPFAIGFSKVIKKHAMSRETMRVVVK